MIQTIRRLIFLNTFKVGDTFWSSDLKKMFDAKPESIGGFLGALRRGKYIEPLYKEYNGNKSPDICWKVIKS